MEVVITQLWVVPVIYLDRWGKTQIITVSLQAVI